MNELVQCFPGFESKCSKLLENNEIRGRLGTKTGLTTFSVEIYLSIFNNGNTRTRTMHENNVRNLFKVNNKDTRMSQ